jgi:hypothetical protein
MQDVLAPSSSSSSSLTWRVSPNSDEHNYCQDDGDDDGSTYRRRHRRNRLPSRPSDDRPRHEGQHQHQHWFPPPKRRRRRQHPYLVQAARRSLSVPLFVWERASKQAHPYLWGWDGRSSSAALPVRAPLPFQFIAVLGRSDRLIRDFSTRRSPTLTCESETATDGRKNPSSPVAALGLETSFFTSMGSWLAARGRPRRVSLTFA